MHPNVPAAAAKSLQSCPTLCDPIDGSPPGSPVPRILQARTLEWVAISFSNAWKWKVKVKSLSHVWLSATPWTAAYQAPPSMGFSRQEYCSGVPLPNVHSSIIYNWQVIEQPEYPSTDEQRRKMWDTHTHTHTHTHAHIHTETWNPTQPLKRLKFCHLEQYGWTWHQAKWNRSDRERQMLHDITYMWILQTTTNYWYNKKETDSQI